MKNFNAEQARKIVEDFKLNNELEEILNQIKIKVRKGKSSLLIYKKLNDETEKYLLEKGLKIKEYNSIALQKDDLYYTIYWN